MLSVGYQTWAMLWNKIFAGHRWFVTTSRDYNSGTRLCIAEKIEKCDNQQRCAESVSGARTLWPGEFVSFFSEFDEFFFVENYRVTIFSLIDCTTEVLYLDWVKNSLRVPYHTIAEWWSSKHVSWRYTS